MHVNMRRVSAHPSHTSSWWTEAPLVFLLLLLLLLFPAHNPPLLLCCWRGAKMIDTYKYAINPVYLLEKKCIQNQSGYLEQSNTLFSNVCVLNCIDLENFKCMQVMSEVNKIQTKNFQNADQLVEWLWRGIKNVSVICCIWKNIEKSKAVNTS